MLGHSKIHLRSSCSATTHLTKAIIGVRVRQIVFTCAAMIVAHILTPTGADAAAEKEYGKPGEPIELVIGYQPYYTESWSGVIMRDKKFYEKYLPKGSKVEFKTALQGPIIATGWLPEKAV